jgi:spermidine synthase
MSRAHRPRQTRSSRLRRVAALRTAHQDLEIWRSDLATEFRVAGAVHAFYHRRRFLTGLVWDMLAAAALLGEREEPRSVLMLGLAGGTSLRTLRHLLPACRFTAIDIDGEIVDLARRHMALDATGVEVVIGDAYEWLRRNRRTFDVVVDDIYLAGRTDVFRPQAMDRHLLDSLRRCIAPGGVLAVNLVTGTGHRRTQSAIRRILCDAFAEVRSVTSPEAMNEVLVAGNTVATARRLRKWDAAFAEAGDRNRWRKIAVRRIAASKTLPPCTH